MDPIQISLCMIVRDEEGMLPGFLASARGAWDELCVVDTGSTDGGPKLLRDAGARLIDQPWRGDFAAARNKSLEMARGDWIVFFDADERIEPGLVPQLREVASDPGAGAATLIMRNPLPHGHVREANLLRMFRNDPGIRFQHRIHEDVSEAVVASLRRSGHHLVHLSGRVTHLGYIRSVAAARQKQARDRELLEACIQQDSDDLYSRFKLMELARFWGDRDGHAAAAGEALEAVGRLGESAFDRLHFAGEMVALMAQGLAPNDPQAALDLMERHCVPDSAAFRLHRAGLHERLGQVRPALADFKACLSLPMERDHQLSTVRPLMGLARLAIQAGRREQAAALIDRALERAPADPEALFAATSMARLEGGAPGLASFARAHKRKHGPSPELQAAVGEASVAAGDPDMGRQWLERAASARQDEAAYGLRLAQAMLAAGDLEAAVALSRKLATRLPEASLGILLCDLIAGRDSDLELDLDPESLDKALMDWLSGLIAGPRQDLVEVLASVAPAVGHVFPWLPDFLAARQTVSQRTA